MTTNLLTDEFEYWERHVDGHPRLIRIETIPWNRTLREAVEAWHEARGERAASAAD